MIYINKTAYNIYVELDEVLDETINFVGKTWDDFMNGAWLLLSDEQVKFHEDNPTASVEEVWKMELTTVTHDVRTSEDAKNEMLSKITEYDSSESVNSFIVNSNILGWFTPEERSNYKSSIDAAKLLGVETLSFFIGDVMLEVSPALAEQMLAQIQLYADRCFIVTKQHKMEVSEILESENIEETEKIMAIDLYDYKSGYPQKLEFDL